jgi:hypothetical protein
VEIGMTELPRGRVGHRGGSSARGLVLGAVIGTVLGAALGDVGAGLLFGAAMGLLLGVVTELTAG